MPGIDVKPLEFRDFSGGLTDNFLQGDPKRYAAADNFLITVDRKLEERPGTIVYDPVGYHIGDIARIGNLFTNRNQDLLFATQGRNIYTQDPSSAYGTDWSAITGPTGNEALCGGDYYSQVSRAEFQRQIYYTSDAGVQPGKIFRDQNSDWKAVTAGLPKMAWIPTFSSDAGMLATCVQLANALRTSMYAHMYDAAYIGSGMSTTNQHKIPDKWSLSYFEAQVWNIITDTEYPGPVPTPTPAPLATDEASLYALCLAMSLAYEHHRNDLAGDLPETNASGGTRVYHQDIIYQVDGTGTSGTEPGLLGLAARLNVSGVVSTLPKAAAFLDELAQKWYWHQLLPLSHSPNNDYALMSRHLSPTGKIGTVYSSPSTVQVTPNYAEFIAFAQWLKNVHQNHMDHVSTGGYHAQSSSFALITLPDPGDYDSAALTIFWARWGYSQAHVFDSNIATHTMTTFDTTAGSTNLTTVKNTTGGAAVTLAVDDWLFTSTDVFDDVNPNNRRAARVVSAGLGTAVLNKTCTGSATVAGQRSTAWYHPAYQNGANFIDQTVAAAGASEFLATGAGAIGTSLEEWIQAGTEYLYAIGTHMLNSTTHFQANSVVNQLSGVSAAGNPFYIPSVVTLAWAAFYRYQYIVEPNGLLYLTQGTPIFSLSTETLASYPIGTVIDSQNTNFYPDITIRAEVANATISNIPALVNTSLTNYDTTVSVAPIPTTGSGSQNNLTIELYRTTDGGTTFYYLTSLTNSTVSYTDTTNDTEAEPGDDPLNTRKTLYTNGGRVGNDQPPLAKYVHEVGGFVYYGAITDTGQYFPQRIRQALSGSPDSAPSQAFDDLEDDIVGLSSSRSNFLALCKSSVYRVSGSFDSLGQGAMTHERIAMSQGCLSGASIVQTEIGVFYAGTDGFYYTDGYQIIKISIDLDKTYLAMTKSDAQKARIYGAYDKLTRRIWWAMQSQPGASDNDVFFIYYLDYGVKPSGVFTKALTTRSWMPSSATFYKGQLIIGDSRGYLFKTDPDTKTDPVIDTLVSPASWNTAYLPYNFKTCALDFGTTFLRKWIPRIHSVGQNIGNAAIQINSINDAGSFPNGASSTQALPVIQYKANPMWGDPSVVWGDEDYDWKYDGTMDVWRRFPSRSLRSDFKQIQYAPATVIVYRSDDWPDFAYANVLGSTATLVTPSGYSALTWPKDVIDYEIAFSTDSYATYYPITALNGGFDVITFTGTATTDATASWQIRGVKKAQRVKITAFDIHFGYLGDENQAYPGASGAEGVGENA